MNEQQFEQLMERLEMIRGCIIDVKAAAQEIKAWLPSASHKLKAEIRALIPKVYQAYYDVDVTPEMFEPVIERLRELSAV